MADAESAKWYVVHTYSGYENKVKADIEQDIAGKQFSGNSFLYTVLNLNGFFYGYRYF